MLYNQRSGNRREGIGVAESDKRKVTKGWAHGLWTMSSTRTLPVYLKEDR